jgi:hypothetical protein
MVVVLVVLVVGGGMCETDNLDRNRRVRGWGCVGNRRGSGNNIIRVVETSI